MKHFILIILTLCCLSQITAQEKAITNVITKINTLIEKGQVDDIMAHFDPTDSSFLKQSRTTYENMLKLDSLNYSIISNVISTVHDTAFAIVFEKKSYFKHERSTTIMGWKTYSFVKKDNAWRICNIQDRNYQQAEFVELKMELNPSERFMSASATVEFSIVEEGESNILFLLNRGLTINKIAQSNGESLAFVRNDLVVEIPWKTDLKKGEKITLNFDYSGTFFNEFEEGGYSLVNIGDEGCFANFVTEWYPKLNGTLTKATADLQYTVPKDLVVASVGKFLKKEESDSTHTYIYKVNTPMDYTFNANKFYHYSSEVDGIQVNVFFIEGNEEKAKMYASKSMEIVTFLKNLYGIFPYDSYTISEVPPSITKALGGSGGQGLNFYPTNGLRDDVFEFPLISHEVGHMWWGSWVMCDDESGDMIAEGFSQLNAVLCYRHFYGEKAMWNFLKYGDDLYSQSARSYFTRFGGNEKDVAIGTYDESTSSSFSQLAYLKAHFVYAMLMEKVGYDTFIKGIRRIITEYANKRFDIPDLKRIMEKESSMNLDNFFDQWFYRKGAPEFKMNYSITPTNDGRFMVSGDVKQLREIYKVSAEIELFTNDSRELRILDINESDTHFEYILNYKPIAVSFDPDYKILRWTDEFKNLTPLNEAIEKTFTGKSEEAIEIYKQIFKTNPYNMTARTYAGYAFLNIKNYDSAQSNFKIVTDQFESDGKMSYAIPVSYSGLGKTYDAIGDTVKASICYSKVLQLVNVDGTHNRAKAFFEKLKEKNID